ncbi:MAG: hypothetical protein D4R83_08850 [Streptomycetaceae bacterium]|nr:MAG: hypothetical protein D4R83_08850 [Streptomycetaceae bacterium]
MKMNHDKFIEAMTNSFEDNRVSTYAVAEAIVREPVAIQERLITLFMHYLYQIKPSVVMPEHMLDLSNFAQASWEQYFELLGISETSDIGQHGDLLELLSDPEGAESGWTNIKIEKEYLPHNYVDESIAWNKESVEQFFRELSTKDLRAMFEKKDIQFNEF